MYSKSSSSAEKSHHPTALDGRTFSTMFAERFAVSLPFGQKSVLTSIDSNGYPSGSFHLVSSINRFDSEGDGGATFRLLRIATSQS